MSKQEKELVRSAQEAVAHSRGKMQLKEFRADMSDEERELFLDEICAPDLEDSSAPGPVEDRENGLASGSGQPGSRRRVAASGRSR